MKNVGIFAINIKESVIGADLKVCAARKVNKERAVMVLWGAMVINV